MIARLTRTWGTSPVARAVILVILLWNFVLADCVSIVCQLLNHPVVINYSDSWNVIVLASVVFGISPEVADLVKSIRKQEK